MPDLSWVAPPIAILISAAVGWSASQRIIKNQRDQKLTENINKKHLVFHLLRNEIEMRWKDKFAPYLRGLLNNAPIDGLEQLAKMELKGDDVFVLKSVSDDFEDYFFLENNNLVSQIIHGYLVVCDLIDLKLCVARTLLDRRDMAAHLRVSLSEQEMEQRLNQKYEKDIAKFWKDFQIKLDGIEERFDEILSQLKIE